MRRDDVLVRLTQALRPHVPCTSLNTVRRLLYPMARSVLDVGCGQGTPMRFLCRQGRFQAVGVDTFEPYLRECQASGIYDDLVRADVRLLPFRSKSFDVVLCMQVLEHLEHEEGVNLINDLEQIARHQVIISSPVGAFPQKAFDGNPHQQHKHIWEPGELRQMGYRVIGHGVRGLGGWSGIRSPLPRALRPLADVVWVMAGPLARLRPEWGGNMVAVRLLSRDEKDGT